MRNDEQDLFDDERALGARSANYMAVIGEARHQQPTVDGSLSGRAWQPELASPVMSAPSALSRFIEGLLRGCE